MAVRVAGPLYPQANAAIVVEDVRGTLTRTVTADGDQLVSI